MSNSERTAELLSKCSFEDRLQWRGEAKGAGQREAGGAGLVRQDGRERLGCGSADVGYGGVTGLPGGATRPRAEGSGWSAEGGVLAPPGGQARNGFAEEEGLPWGPWARGAALRTSGAPRAWPQTLPRLLGCHSVQGASLDQRGSVSPQRAVRLGRRGLSPRSCQRRLVPTRPEVPPQPPPRAALRPGAPLIGRCRSVARPARGLGAGAAEAAPARRLDAGARRRWRAIERGWCWPHGAAAAPGGPGGCGRGAARGYRRAESGAASRAQPRDLPPRQVRPSRGGEAAGRQAEWGLEQTQGGGRHADRRPSTFAGPSALAAALLRALAAAS